MYVVRTYIRTYRREHREGEVLYKVDCPALNLWPDVLTSHARPREAYARVYYTRVYHGLPLQSRFVPKTCCTGARKISIDFDRVEARFLPVVCKDVAWIFFLKKKNIFLKDYPFSFHFNDFNSIDGFFFSIFFSCKTSFGCRGISPLNAKSSFGRASPPPLQDKPWGWNIAGVVATGGENPHESSKSIPKAPTDPSFLPSSANVRNFASNQFSIAEKKERSNPRLAHPYTHVYQSYHFPFQRETLFRVERTVRRTRMDHESSSSRQMCFFSFFVFLVSSNVMSNRKCFREDRGR